MYIFNRLLLSNNNFIRVFLPNNVGQYINQNLDKKRVFLPLLIYAKNTPFISKYAKSDVNFENRIFSRQKVKYFGWRLKHFAEFFMSISFTDKVSTLGRRVPLLPTCIKQLKKL